MCNYLSAYATNLSAITKRLRMLTQGGSEFIWSTTQQDAFDKARRIISYTLDVTYKRGSSLCVADTLSRAALSMPMEAKVTGFEVFRLRFELDDRQPNARLKPATQARPLK